MIARVYVIIVGARLNGGQWNYGMSSWWTSTLIHKQPLLVDHRIKLPKTIISIQYWWSLRKLQRITSLSMAGWRALEIEPLKVASVFDPLNIIQALNAEQSHILRFFVSETDSNAKSCRANSRYPWKGGGTENWKLKINREDSKLAP